MGHATIEMTMRYSHLSPQVSKETIKLLDTRGQHTGDMEFAVEVNP